jgi:PAS domain S-box-containing protein
MAADAEALGQLGRADLTYEEAEALLRRLARGLPGVVPAARPPAETPPPVGHAPHAGLPASRHAEHALPAAQFRDFLEAVPDSLVVIDRDGRIVLVNGQTEKLFGYRREELLGQVVELLVPERFRARHAGYRAAYVAAPRVRPMGATLELYGRRKDGSDVPVEISLSPLQTEQGQLVVSTIRDITARVQAEARQRQLEARYRTLVEGIPAVTFLAALAGGVNELYVSPQIEALLGFSQKEWLEDPILWYTRLHPDDRPRWHLEFAHTCATGEPFRSVYRFLARDGRVVWVHGEAKVVRDDDGRPLFLQGVAFDITGMKQAEEELKALNQTLEQRVAERTAVAEERARELERSNTALNEFSYVVTHDLREPLRSIKSFTQKLAQRYQGKLKDQEADDWMTRTINATDRMSTLIQNLLEYSRVRTQGKEPVPVGCTAALTAACANLEAAVEESGALVTADDLPTVLADETQLVQLFQNLIANALKFRGEEPPHIHVSARRDGDYWRLAVADNGLGIEAQHLGKLFNKIGQEVRYYPRSKYPGHGIGLGTCEKIVRRHGGQIGAQSPGLGQGSTFWFTLPAATPD